MAIQKSSLIWFNLILTITLKLEKKTFLRSFSLVSFSKFVFLQTIELTTKTLD